MIYLMSEIALYLLAAAVFGALVGWMLHAIESDNKAEANERLHKQKLLTNEKNHRDILEKYSQNSKRLRAEVSRLNTNNKALRANINSNNRTLEMARSEIATLSKKIAQYEIDIPELAMLHDDDSEQDFDKTMIIADASSFDSTVIEVKEHLIVIK